MQIEQLANKNIVRKPSVFNRFIAGLAIAGVAGVGVAVAKEPVHDFVRPQSTVAPGVKGQIENIVVVKSTGFNGKIFSYQTSYELGIEQCAADRQDIADNGVKDTPDHFDSRVGVVAPGCEIDQVLINPQSMHNTVTIGGTITIGTAGSSPLRKLR